MYVSYLIELSVQIRFDNIGNLSSHKCCKNRLRVMSFNMER